MRLASTRGMKMSGACVVTEVPLRDRDDHGENVDKLRRQLNMFQRHVRNESKSFVLVIIPAKNSVIYKQVKQASELFEVTLTQCIVRNNIKQGPRLESVVGNLILKINSKLGGVNHVPLPPSEQIQKMLNKIDILSYPCMIIGIDVTHPPPGLDKVWLPTGTAFILYSIASDLWKVVIIDLMI